MGENTMSVVIASVGSQKNNDRVECGSGVVVDSGSSGFSCGCSCSIKILSWSECDTISKKIGFIIGKSINLLSSLFSKTYELVLKIPSKTIEILYIDKLYDLFHTIIHKITKKMKCFIENFFENCLKPVYNWTLSPLYNRVLSPIFSKINDFRIYLCNAIFKSNISNETTTSDCKISNIFNSISNGLKIINDWTLNPLWNRIIVPLSNWTVKPVWDKILVPIFNSIGDIFIGMIGGAFHKEPINIDSKEKNKVS